MASPDVTAIYRVPGRLCYGPTTDPPTDDYPHGGTALGVVSYLTVSVEKRYERCVAAEYGGELENVIDCGEDLRLFGLLRQWDEDAYTLLFPDVDTGAGGGFLVDAPGDYPNAGLALSSKEVKLLFSPYGPEDPALIVYAAIPRLQVVGEAHFEMANRWRLLSELRLAVAFEASRDAQGRRWKMGKLADLTL